MRARRSIVMVVGFCCIVQWLCESFSWFNWVIKLTIFAFNYLSKSKSQRLRTSSRTDRFRCGKSDESISIAFWETSGDFEVDETDESSGFLCDSSENFDSASSEPECSVFGSVTVIPNIFPGGSDSKDFPVSLEASRSAIASSTACWRFSATCNKNLFSFKMHFKAFMVVKTLSYFNDFN